MRNDDFVVHHKDKNELNDSIENLIKMTNADHTSLHFKNMKKTDEAKIKMSLSKKERIIQCMVKR